jgi:hypothetical protein
MQERSRNYRTLVEQRFREHRIGNNQTSTHLVPSQPVDITATRRFASLWRLRMHARF